MLIERAQASIAQDIERMERIIEILKVDLEEIGDAE